MNSHLARISPRWLTAIALTVGGLLFVMPYVLRVIFAVLSVTPIMDSPNFLSALSGPLSFLVILFSEVWGYVLISVAVSGLVLTALRWGRPGRVTRGLLVLTLLAILGFPWFFRYEPAVAAAPGYTLRWPTEPALLAGVAKRAQIVTEQRPCTYALLGWSANASLYYQATCSNGLDQIWLYNPNTSTSTLPVTTAPTDLSTAVRAHSQVLELVRVSSIYPPEAEPSTRSISVRDNGLASPDGRWVALVVRHVYGPEDVIVVSSGAIDRK
jgi:hypothetical protein